MPSFTRFLDRGLALACAGTLVFAACSDAKNTGANGTPVVADTTGDGLQFGGTDAAADADSGADAAPTPDAGADAGSDAVADVGQDAKGDAKADAVADAGAEVSDIAADVPVDAAADVPEDVGADIADVSGVADVSAVADVSDVAEDIAADIGPDAAVDVGADAATSPWGSFTKLGCNKYVNTNTDGTVNPFIAPARNGQFYVSYVAKGGDLMLTWEAPSTCKTVEGPFQVNSTKGDVYYWGGIAVTSDPAGNFYAVWESNTKNAEISFAWSETGKTFLPPIELVSTSTNGQDAALWAPTPGVVHAVWRGHHPSLSQYDPYYAVATNVLTSKKFSTGVMVHGDAQQDDQVAIVTDSKGKIYVGWQSFDGDMYLSRSIDAGKTWSPPVQVNDVKGKANVGKASFLAITNTDRLVMAWSDTRKSKSGNENDVFADSSADGVTWGADVQINDNDARYQEDPSLAVGLSGKCKGAVYAVWQDFRGKKSYDIFGSRSVDGGLTWSTNEAVANDLEGDEMNPAIAVDGACVIGVAWRDGAKNKDFDIGTTYLKW